MTDVNGEITLLTAAEARAIAKPDTVVVLQAQKNAVAEAISDASKSGLTQIVVRLNASVLGDLVAWLRAAGYEWARARMLEPVNDNSVAFINIYW